MPNVRQTLYSDLVVALAAEPQAALGTDDDKDSLPVARGLPRSWDEIAPGHLVIAQESLEYGWWEAIVLDRKGDMFTLRYRDYPQLPKFVRHRTAVALMSPPATKPSLEAARVRQRPEPLPRSRTTASPPTKIWRSVMDTKTARIRALNDELRQNFAGGIAVMTPGIAALGAEAVARIVKTIAVFDDFCHANDPHEEHDFGSFDADGQRIFFKIDYFDESLHHSPDPADPSVTKRVITIMLAEEY